MNAPDGGDCHPAARSYDILLDAFARSVVTGEWNMNTGTTSRIMAVLVWMAAYGQEPCGILTPADIKVGGGLYVFVDSPNRPMVKQAYEEEVQNNRNLGYKEENRYGEKSYIARLDDQSVLGFLKGKYYYRFLANESTARKVAQVSACHRTGGAVGPPKRKGPAPRCRPFQQTRDGQNSV
ncbi:MAG: hypothetical protein HY820_19480 [Acidobacteria bacterium]|nr:hypothetical protein [Acidobacteriota bacterium]